MSWKLTQEVLPNSGFPYKLKHFIHEKTRLRLVNIHVPGPTVHGHFVVSTEAFDHDGCPHVLEHLIFLGSERFPYKGVLDSVANRSMAQGTNAWTDVDHTCYTICTAGSQGFLQILPVYLDHILFPTLTDSGFLTEVHHINGQGEDAGVVYCEMQGRQNSADDLMQFELMQALYPGSGYQSETGGKMENLRSLSVDVIRRYHERYYNSGNVCIIVSGMVEDNDLFEALGSVVNAAERKQVKPISGRPWVDSEGPKVFDKTVTKVVKFPDEDEDVGRVVIGWRDLDYHDFRLKESMSMMFTYLSEGPISPLQKVFVEIQDPLCTEFTSVPIERIEEICPLLFSTIENIEFDVERMKTLIERQKLSTLDQLELEPHTYLSHPCITDSIYGNLNGNELEAVFKEIEYLNELEKWSSNEWKLLLNTWLLKKPYVLLLGKPCSSLASDMVTLEKERIEKQRQVVNLDLLEQQLNTAKQLNEKEIPIDLISSFKVPDVRKINFHPIASKDSFIQGIPLFFDSITSNFVEFDLIVDTKGLDCKYVEILLSVFFEPCLVRDGNEYMSRETVVQELEKDTLSNSASCGFNRSCSFDVGAYSNYLVFSIKSDVKNMDKIKEWFQKIIEDGFHSAERLSCTVQKLMNDIPDCKRDGYQVVSAAMKHQFFQNDNQIETSFFTQSQFLKKLSKTNPASIEEEFNRFYKDLFSDKSRWMFHVIGDEKKIGNITLPWRVQSQTEFIPMFSNANLLENLKSIVIRVPSIENTMALWIAKGPTSYNDSDNAALMVLNEYLTTMEGPFWKEIRGQGLAYSCSLNLDVSLGLIQFLIFSAPDAYKAFAAAKQIVTSLQFDPIFLESTKSSVLFSLISKQETISHAASQSFFDRVFKKRSTQDLMISIQNVTLNDLNRVVQKYVVKIFEPSTSALVLVSCTAKFNEQIDALEKIGYLLESYDNVDKAINKLIKK